MIRLYTDIRYEITPLWYAILWCIININICTLLTISIQYVQIWI